MFQHMGMNIAETSLLLVVIKCIRMMSLGQECRQAICQSWPYTIVGANQNGNLEVRLVAGQGLESELWYFVFVPGYTDEAMIVNYANRVFWSVIHEKDQSRVYIASTDCSNAPKFRIVYLKTDTAAPGYYAILYTDPNNNEMFILNSTRMELERIAPTSVEGIDWLHHAPLEEKFVLNPFSSIENRSFWIPPCFPEATTEFAIVHGSSADNYLTSTITSVDVDNGIENTQAIEEQYAGLWTILPICKNRKVPHPDRKNFEDFVDTNALCSPMPSNDQKISRIVSTLGAFWITACVIFTFTLMLILREWSYERYLHMCQEIILLLIHLIILFTAQRTEWEITCHVVSIILQYLYTCLFSLLFLETIQAYCIKTNVIPSSFRIDYFRTHALIIGLPAVITLPTAYFGWASLISIYSCWINYENRLAVVTMATVLVLSMLSVSMLESIYQKDYKPLGLSNMDQRFMADINLWTLWFRLSLHVASWLFMSFAIFYQRFSLFPMVFVINVALGTVVLASHILASRKVV